MRIDLLLFRLGLAKSRTHAANLIKLGEVFLNEKQVIKPSLDVMETDIPVIKSTQSFFTLGGAKLKKAVDEFSISFVGKNAIDCGCSNGGFTGVMLEGGIESVLAIDVGENVLPEAIMQDGRVNFLQKNIRYLQKSDLLIQPDLIVADLSFISIKQVLPVFRTLLLSKGELVVLIKPQFEVGRKALNKSGVVKDPKIRQSVVNDIMSAARDAGFKILGITPAPHPFLEKNQEYLLYATV